MSTTLEAPPSDLAPRIRSNRAGAFPPITGREEEWRFTPIKQIADFLQDSPRADLRVSSSSGTGNGITCGEIPIADVSDGWEAVDLPSAIARQNVRTALVVTISPEIDATEPVVLRLSADAAGSYAHIVIDAQRHSRATVVLEHDPQHDVSGAIVAHVGEGADLTVLSAWNGDGAGKQLWQMPAFVERDAQFRGLVVSLAGSFLRLCPSVEYRGAGGSAEIWGAFLADGSEYQEHRIFVDHATPHCTSKVIYKGALSGSDSHTVWIGDVLVRREAVGIETYELNRNLLLNDGPRADSVPNLELETGDVLGAGHASATGRFDDEQLFYLQSRGIPENLARQLVVRGFFADVIASISDASVREAMMAGIDKRIGIAGSGEGDV